MTVFGLDAYPTLLTKAAALMKSLARNHALLDGNKRTAWAAAWTWHRPMTSTPAPQVVGAKVAVTLG